METLSLAVLVVVVAFMAIYAFVKIKLATKGGLADYSYETVIDENGNAIEKVVNNNEKE